MGKLLAEIFKRLLRRPPTRGPAPKPPAKPSGAKGKADRQGAAGKKGTPCAGCNKPARRHDPCKTKGSDPKKYTNTMIDPDVSDVVSSEVNDIIAGKLEKVGEYWTAPSGRRYGQHNNSIHPVDGPGLQNITRMQHTLNKQLNDKGLDGAKKMIDTLQSKGILSKEQVDQVVNLWKKCKK